MGVSIQERWTDDAAVVLYPGDTRELLGTMPDDCAQLVITSPPYNLAKAYERKRLDLEEYVRDQAQVIGECVRILRRGGSLCWEVGNHVTGDEIVPLDLLLYPVFRRHRDPSSVTASSGTSSTASTASAASRAATR